MDEDTLVRRHDYAIDIRMDGGESVRFPAGGEADQARAELEAIYARLGTATFVLVGDDVVIRAADIRSIRLVQGHTDEGMFDSLQSRLRGSQMSNYDADQELGRGGATATQSPGAGMGHQPMQQQYQQHQQQHDGPGFVDQYIGYGRRPYAETKPFWLTSEFLSFLGVLAGIAIAMGVLDNFDAPRGWILITAIGAAYILSRGIAKAGERDPNPNRSGSGGSRH